MSSLRKSNGAASLHTVSPTAWLVTFSDLLTLLLTLFVLRLSMSSLDNKAIVEKLRIHHGRDMVLNEEHGTSGIGLLPYVQVPDPTTTVQHTETTTALADGLSRQLGERRMNLEDGKGFRFQSDIQLRDQAGGSLLFLTGSTFLSGSDELSFRAEEVVSAIGKTLADKPVEVTIAGHTDNQGINTSRFPSNWELSAARAIAVARQMIDAGVEPQAISAVGYADTKPIADNRTLEGRHQNRRVEIYVSPVEGQKPGAEGERP